MTRLKNTISLLAARLSRPTWQLLKVRKSLAQKQLEAATIRITEIQSKYPQRPDVNLLFAQIYAQHSDWIKVRRGLENILGNPQSKFQELIAAAGLMREMGDENEAILVLKKLGLKSQGKQAELCWLPVGNLFKARGEFDPALQAYVECVCRNGPAVWSQIITVVQCCSIKCIDQCRIEMLKRPQKRFLRYRYFKLLSLLEHRLCLDRTADPEPTMRCMRNACEDSFHRVYPDIKLDEGSPPLKPSFLIIGAMKCGTTSLFQLISQHPQCLMTFEKEHQFFQFPHLLDQWYLEHFPRISSSRNYITGDASPGYYIFDIVERVKTLLPNIKILFIQRDPAERAISHILHNRRVGLTDDSPKIVTSRIDELQNEIESNPTYAEQIILDITYRKRKHNNFLAIGCYELLLRRWKRHFSQDQLKILHLEDLHTSPQETMNGVFEFLGLEPFQVQTLKSNAGHYDQSEPEVRQALERLTQFYDSINRATNPAGNH